MDILQLSHYLDNLLEINSIRDAPHALNGLQIQNQGEIKKIGLAVDLCQATIDLAIKKQCQMLFVHHGAFWSGLQPIRGKHYKKLSTMMQANLALYSAHIPLDLHPVYGNNRALADLIGLENLETFLLSKRELAIAYADFFNDTTYQFVQEPIDSQSNYWLNAIILKDQEQRDLFLEHTNSMGIGTRPAWTLMHKLAIFESCQFESYFLKIFIFDNFWV